MQGCVRKKGRKSGIIIHPSIRPSVRPSTKPMSVRCCCCLADQAVTHNKVHIIHPTRRNHPRGKSHSIPSFHHPSYQSFTSITFAFPISPTKPPASSASWASSPIHAGPWQPSRPRRQGPASAPSQCSHRHRPCRRSRYEATPGAGCCCRGRRPTR